MSGVGVLRLRKAGFTRKQAEALAAYLDDQFASKADLQALKASLLSRNGETNDDVLAAFRKLETGIEVGFTRFGQNFQAGMKELELSLLARLDEVKVELVQWYLAGMVVTVITTVAILKLSP